MKKVLFILMLAFGFSFVQQTVITRPYDWGWAQIVNNVTLTSADTSSAFAIDKYNGNQTLWFKIGTVDSIKSDVTVKLELKNNETGGWGTYLSGSTLVAIGNSNITANNEFYIKMTDYDPWAWADSARIILSVSSTSSFTCDVYIGGQ